SAPARFAVRRSGVYADRRVASHNGPAVALAQHAQVRDLLLVQLLVAVSQVEHGVVEPFLLMLSGRFQHTTTEDVSEQLVSGLLKGGGGRWFARLRTLFGHAGALLSRAEGAGHGSAAPQCNRGGRAVKGPAAGIGRWYNQTAGWGSRASDAPSGRRMYE